MTWININGNTQQFELGLQGSFTSFKIFFVKWSLFYFIVLFYCDQSLSVSFSFWMFWTLFNSTVSMTISSKISIIILMVSRMPDSCAEVVLQWSQSVSYQAQLVCKNQNIVKVVLKSSGYHNISWRNCKFWLIKYL